MDKYIKVGIGVMILDGNKVLLGHRSANKKDTGGIYEVDCWTLPGGKQEYDENIFEGAKREIKEETNLDVKIDDSFKEKTTFFVKEKNNYKDLILFLAQPISTNIIPQEGEIIDCKWYSYNKAMELLKYPDLKQILTKAFKYINTNN